MQHKKSFTVNNALNTYVTKNKANLTHDRNALLKKWYFFGRLTSRTEYVFNEAVRTQRLGGVKIGICDGYIIFKS